MKRLIVALVAAVAVSAAFAKLTYTQGFEGESYDPSTEFKPSVDDEDASEVVAYDNDAPAFPAPYDFEDFGSKYLSLDTGDATLWRTNADEAAYFDMAMQFNPCASAPEIDEDTKIAVYLNSDSNLVVLAGTELGDGTSTNVTGVQLAPGTWGRLTIAASANQFTVTLNTNTVVGTYYSRKLGDTTIKQVGFKGTGALDDFVARTTDPFIQNPAAMIGGEGYASFADALADLDDGQYIELLADASVNFDAAGTTLAVRENSHTLTVTTTGDIAVTRTPDASTGIFTYTTADGVASLNGTWYPSFEAAYSHASSTSDRMVVKIDDDFVPTLTGGTRTFASVIFTNVSSSAESISIATTDGVNIFKATSWEFPTNATLSLNGVYSVTAIKGGTLEILDGAVISLNSYTALDGISAIVGSGTLVAPASPVYFLAQSTFVTGAKLAENGWRGVCSLSGTCTAGIRPNRLGNANSTIRFSGFTSDYIFGGTYSANIEVEGNGLTVNYSLSANQIAVFTGALSGSGSITANTSGSCTQTLNFRGDTSQFTGNLTANGMSRVSFGSNYSYSAPNIYIHTDGIATNAAGSTWTTAGNVYVAGELVADGTVSGAALCGNGTYRANASTAAITADSSWTGTYVVGWNAANANSPFYINEYGTNSAATIQIDGVNGEFTGYPWLKTAGVPNVTAKIVLNANWTLANGSSGSTTKFASLSGTGNLTINPNNVYGYPYEIGTLDNYSGTLGGNAGAYTIGKVKVATQPAAGARVVKANIGTYGSLNDNVPLWVADGDTGIKLRKGSAGLYAPTVQSGDDYYLSITNAIAASKTTVTLLADNAENVVLPAGGSIVKDGFKYTGTATTAEGYTVVTRDGVVVSEKNVYNIEFISGEGSTTNVVPTAYNDMPDAPVPAEVTGKSFSAWDPAVVAAVATATYNALYTNNIYTVTVEGGANMTVAVYTNGVEEAAGAAGDYVLEYGDSIRVKYTAAQDYKITTDTSTNIVGIVEDVVVAAATVEACEYYTAVTLNKATTSIETNLTETLVATFTPESAADDSYTWASSDTSKATVDENGVVTAIAAGEVTITVTADHDKSVTASCVVTVTATGPTPEEDIPVLPENPTYDDVTNAVEKAQFVDDAVKTIINGDATTYNTFKAWADTVSGGEAAVVASEHAAASYQLKDIVETATLFENEPTLTFTEIKPAASGSNWDVTVELKDGDTAVQLKALKANFATRVWKGSSLTEMTQCTESDVTSVEQDSDGKKVKLTVTPPATGNAGFIKIKAE